MHFAVFNPLFFFFCCFKCFKAQRKWLTISNRGGEVYLSTFLIASFTQNSKTFQTNNLYFFYYQALRRNNRRLVVRRLCLFVVHALGNRCMLVSCKIFIVPVTAYKPCTKWKMMIFVFYSSKSVLLLKPWSETQVYFVQERMMGSKLLETRFIMRLECSHKKVLFMRKIIILIKMIHNTGNC